MERNLQELSLAELYNGIDRQNYHLENMRQANNFVQQDEFYHRNVNKRKYTFLELEAQLSELEAQKSEWMAELKRRFVDGMSLQELLRAYLNNNTLYMRLSWRTHLYQWRLRPLFERNLATVSAAERQQMAEDLHFLRAHDGLTLFVSDEFTDQERIDRRLREVEEPERHLATMMATNARLSNDSLLGGLDQELLRSILTFTTRP